MAGFVLFLLLGLILLGVPVGFALMMTAAAAMAASGVNLLVLPVQMFSGSKSIVLLAIPLFILMGELMSATSISERLIAVAYALVGWIRGGLSHVNVLTSMFMAEMSGSAVADAAVMSKIFVPEMERHGYPRSFAGALTAVSATLGIIIPPSIPMVLYGVTTNTSIRDLFVAGIVPGLILGGAFMAASWLFALKEGHPRANRFEAPALGRALWRAAVPLLIPVLVVGGLIVGVYTPTEAAGIGVLIALAFGFLLSRDLTLARLGGILTATARQTAVVMMIVAGSAVLGQYLANEQLPQKIAGMLGGVTDVWVVELLLINLFLLVLGMFLHASAAIIVVVPLLMPLARQLGIDPVHFGVIVCLNLGIGQQTPPVASVLLTVCSTTGLKIEQVMAYGKWFIAVMFLVLLLVTYLPWTALWWR
ncbi:TRAP transporter, DctM subunit [Tistlia consotensis]|uniref:TRAP transporter large permease protein n=1 Tax=Tistlia consotensis USBA 355 TaxID=560819 RepID=A0A1Y6BCD2_9PROT|nr:TRAP transporter large permease [Tistlia consotensis]SME93670.1 TRAP transporter, DctM subunit [Tistlia consotensis USBA 355]SNR28730.1 TRAP transporter, DctM subunit [Tistlia consotensis]